MNFCVVFSVFFVAIILKWMPLVHPPYCPYRGRVTMSAIISPLAPRAMFPSTRKGYFSSRRRSKPTRLERMARICLAYTQNSNPLLGPEPWEAHLFGGAEECRAATGGAKDKKKAAQDFNLWLSARNPDEIVVYTDGSQKLGKAGKIAGSGTAWTIEWKWQRFVTNGFSLGADAEVYDAEIIGLCGGFRVLWRG